MIRISVKICLLLFTLIAAPAQSGAQTPANGYTYKRLEGMIGKQRVVLHLHTLERTTNTGPDPTPYTYYFGTYFYADRQIPIQIEGVVDSTGMIVLNESVMDEMTGTWHLNKSFKGYWLDGKGDNMQNIKLLETYAAGSAPFTGKTLSESMPWKADQKDSPSASVNAFWLEPGGTPGPSLVSEVNRKTVQFTVGDSAYYQGCCADMKQAFQYIKDKEFNSFKEMMASNTSQDSILHRYLYNTEFEMQTHVFYNERYLLSMGIYTYYYSGGAHGMYNIRCFTYDIRNYRNLTLDDIFKKGYELHLGKYLDAAARRRVKMDDKAPLSAHYFTDEIPVTQNFYVTPAGITFCYDPYEIASYAEGQVQLYLPFDQIPQLVKPDFKW